MDTEGNPLTQNRVPEQNYDPSKHYGSVWFKSSPIFVGAVVFGFSMYKPKFGKGLTFERSPRTPWTCLLFSFAAYVASLSYVRITQLSMMKKEKLGNGVLTRSQPILPSQPFLPPTPSGNLPTQFLQPPTLPSIFPPPNSQHVSLPDQFPKQYEVTSQRYQQTVEHLNKFVQSSQQLMENQQQLLHILQQKHVQLQQQQQQLQQQQLQQPGSGVPRTTIPAFPSTLPSLNMPKSPFQQSPLQSTQPISPPYNFGPSTPSTTPPIPLPPNSSNPLVPNFGPLSSPTASPTTLPSILSLLQSTPKNDAQKVENTEQLVSAKESDSAKKESDST